MIVYVSPTVSKAGPGSESSAGEEPGRTAGPHLKHIRSLDGLRGIAVLAVLLYHFAPGLLPGGFLGVDLFFVLSGFLITGLLVNEWSVSGRIALGGFWGRRARRLLPAVLVLLAVMAGYALLFSDEFAARSLARDGLASLFYVANWHFIQAGEAYIQVTNPDLSPLRHMWSLAIEEQFYLVWPLVVTGIGFLVANRWQAGGRPLRLAIGGLSIALGLASFAAMILLYDPAGPDRVYYGTDSRAFLLLIGATVGALTAGGPTVNKAHSRNLIVGAGTAVAAGLLALMALVDVGDSWLYQGGYGLIGLAMILVLVAAAQPGSHPLRWVLERRWLVGLGLISYGVYLWHWPAVIWLTSSATGLDGPALFAIRTAATLTAALASYYLIEIPIRQRRWRMSNISIWLRPLPAVLIIGLALLFMVPALASPVPDDAPPPAPGNQVEGTLVSNAYRQAPHCDDAEKRDEKLSGMRVLLVGNSVADEIEECLGTLLNRHGAEMESIAENATKICELADKARRHFAGAGSRPNVVIVFYVQIYEGCAASEESHRAYLEELLEVWEDQPIHTYLVPFVPAPEEEAVPVSRPEGSNYNSTMVEFWLKWHANMVPLYESLAAGQPERITVVDAGKYLRDDEGRLRWRMPCISPDEPECDAGGQLVVRFPVDGVHFCTYPGWDGGVCHPDHEGGRRRVVSAIAEPLLDSRDGRS